MKTRFTFLASLSFCISTILTEGDFRQDENGVEDDEDAWVEWDATTREYTFVDDSSRVTELKQEPPPDKTPSLQEKQKKEVYNGPGAMGMPYFIEDPTPEQQKLIEEGYQRHAFNEYISDQISFHRNLPDYRNHWCKKPGLYQNDLLGASVVMCFHNEALSVLLRSVHSILDRTPEQLLTEIVLVDDNSNFENLGQTLEEHVKALPKVKLVRSSKRLGLIRARMMGADNAKGPILVFLDSHVEVTEGWYEPLADRISKDWRNVVCPIIDVISDDTLEYKLSERSVTAVGGFTWDLIFTWKTATDEVLRSLKTPADPVPSPTMAGGLFAIHKQFFDRLGQYDEEFEIWGAENLEISFKTWLCGGRLEIIPCSHIGHLYRKRSPYSRNGTENRPHRNYIRLAAVWLDEYAKFYFNKIGNNLGDYGDISSRLALKEKLQCQPFDWYIKNVYPDIFNPKLVVAQGEIRNEAFGGNICLDAFARPPKEENPETMVSHKPQAWGCHKQGGNQYWYLTQIGELRRDESCLDYAGAEIGLQMYHCHGYKGNQLWNYDPENGFIIHVISQLCLTLDDRNKISMETCEGRITQRWNVWKVNLKRIKKLQLLINEVIQNFKSKII